MLAPIVKTIFRMGLFLAAGSCLAAGPLTFTARSRTEVSNQCAVVERPLTWDPKKTAIIICDMWDEHWCKGASQRVAEMAPTLNRVITEARQRGVLIIHAPSGTMNAYKDTPQRSRAQQAPKAEPPASLKGWRALDPSREPPLPIDDSDGGCDCQPKCKTRTAWKGEIATLQITAEDVISDNGEEIYNVLQQAGIDNLIIMGVHANMCVLGRSFAIRRMVGIGKNVVLMRDLTDTMYNSRARPFVSHFRGTDLIVEHIERYWCPTISSDQVLGGVPFRFKEDTRPRVLCVIAEDEYRTWETLPAFARTTVEGQLGYPVTVLTGEQGKPESVPALARALDQADLLMLSVRRRALPAEDMAALRRYLAAGKPLVAIRTSSHAFDMRGKHAPGRDEWPEFDREVLGCDYNDHYARDAYPSITFAPDAVPQEILTGVKPFTAGGSLYKLNPLVASATPLLIGQIPGKPAEPVALVNSFGKSRIFYTSLGNPEDFKNSEFVKLLTNATLWVLNIRS